MKEEYKQKLQQLKNELNERLKNIRGHRLNLSYLENLEIEIFNSKQFLKSLCLISQLDPLTFRLEPYDVSYLKEIEKSLSQRKNLSLMKEKNSLIVKFPPLTEEIKKEIFKELSNLKEEIRIKSRILRDEMIKKLKANKDKMSEDEFYKTKEFFDEEIEKFNQEVDKIFQQKEKEI